MLLEKMTSILSGAHNSKDKNDIPPLQLGKGRDKSVPTMNKAIRDREAYLIQMENERMLARLQDSKSAYNVYDWEQDRKVQTKRVHQICKYEPSLLEKKFRSRGKKTGFQSVEPNRALFDLYQQSVREYDSLT